MSVVGNIFNGKADFDFEPIWKKTLPLSLGLTVLSLVLLLTIGLARSIDFEGGGVWEVPDETSSVADVRAALPSGKQDAKIQVVTGTEGRRSR